MRLNLVMVMSCVVITGCSTTQDWLDRLGRGSGTNAGSLTEAEIISGLKEALAVGVEHAVTNLGREGGFFRDLQVRIPLPESLRPVERTLRTLGQGQLVDEFHATINRAAETAVPEAAEVLANAIKQMTLADAEQILRGPPTAATDYFRRTSETNLFDRFIPIVKRATASTGVTAAYKRMTERAGIGALSEAILGREAVDIDSYITSKALDGLFLKMAEQEKLIRENPAARTSQILRKVFGVLSGGDSSPN